MTSCCHPHQMPWSGATGAIARCKRVSTGCGRKRRAVRVLRWICGVKLKPKAVNKPLPYFIVHELDRPGSSATVSINVLVVAEQVRRIVRVLQGPEPLVIRPIGRFDALHPLVGLEANMWGIVAAHGEGPHCLR